MKPKFIAVAGGALIVAGSFLPWVTLSSSFESATFAGFDEGLNGPLTVVIGLAAIVAALLAKEIPGQNGSLPAAICGIIGIGLVTNELLGLLAVWGQLLAQGIQVAVGIGLVAIFVGGVLAAYGGYAHNPGVAEPAELPSEPSGAEPMPAIAKSWSDTWIAAVTKPIVATYESIAHDPAGSSSRAYRWVFVSALIAIPLRLVIGAPSIGGVFVGTLVCAALLAPAVAVLGLAISAGISNAVARLLGGSGNYSRLVYCYAAHIAPLLLVSSMLSVVPVVYVMSLGAALGTYESVLTVIAIKAVHEFGWGRAIVSSFGILLLLVAVAIVVIVILALLGPAIGNIFSNIVNQI